MVPAGATTNALVGVARANTKRIVSSCLGAEAGGSKSRGVSHADGDAARRPGSGAAAQQGGTVEGTPAWSIGRTWRSYRRVVFAYACLRSMPRTQRSFSPGARSSRCFLRAGTRLLSVVFSLQPRLFSFFLQRLLLQAVRGELRHRAPWRRGDRRGSPRQHGAHPPEQPPTPRLSHHKNL